MKFTLKKNIKEWCKNNDMSASKNLNEDLDDIILTHLIRAKQRAKANKRSTVMCHDL